MQQVHDRELALNKKKGTATLTLSVPGAGTLTATGNGLKKATGKPTAVGATKLKLKALGKAKRKLDEEGTIKLKLSLRWAPTGNTAATQTVKVKLEEDDLATGSFDGLALSPERRVPDDPLLGHANQLPEIVIDGDAAGSALAGSPCVHEDPVAKVSHLHHRRFPIRKDQAQFPPPFPHPIVAAKGSFDLNHQRMPLDVGVHVVEKRVDVVRWSRS